MAILPFPITGEPKKAYFSTAARITKLLGSESVSDAVIALLELIKNSYDADASDVTIVFENIRQGSSRIKIIDNGIGMTEDDINKKWMRTATNNKEIEQFTSELKRRKIGEKGVGRFATERLAKKVILVSKPKNLSTGYGLIIDWSEFEKNADEDIEKIPNQLFTFSKQKKERGLEIHLEDLKETWDEDKIKRFRDDVSLIIPPVGGSQKFNIRILAEEFKKYTGKIKSNFLKEADYIFSGKLGKSGEIKYSLKTCEGKTHKDNDTIKQFSCGPAEFMLYFYYLGPSEYIPHVQRERDYALRKSILQDFGGIKLYRDNFRVKPFGDPSNDWLGLDKERVNSPGTYPGNNQMFGFVKIKRDENLGIRDTASRENILSNAAFNDLKYFIKGSLKFFTKKRTQIEGKIKPSASKKAGNRTKKKKKNLIRESFKKQVTKPAIDLLPQDLMDKLPSEITIILDEINGCLYYEYWTAAAILMRKALEVATILKFVQEKTMEDITSNGEFFELPKRIEVAKQKRYISLSIATKLIKDNKIKLFGDTAAHSYRIIIKPTDVAPMRDLLRLVLEDISLKK